MTASVNVIGAGLAGSEAAWQIANQGVKVRLYAGLNAARIAQGKDPVIFPEETMMGAMAHYITHASVKNFQPINANFGIVPKLQERIRNKQERNLKISERAIDRIKKFKNLNFD